MQAVSQNQNDFSQGSVLSTMLRLSIPMILAQLVNVLYSIIDRIYIGHLGTAATNALSGIGICLPLITIFMGFANIVGMGGSPLFSMERGRKNEEEAEAILGNGFTMLLIFGVSLTCLGLLFRRPLLYGLGASSVTFPYANAYLTIYLFGTTFSMLSLGLNAFINAQGFAKTGMMTVVLGAVSNLILDPIFIFLLDFGVQGAAIATVISQFLSALWTFRFLTGSKTLLKIRLRHMHCQGKRVKKIVALGLTGFTVAFTNSLVQMVGNVQLQAFGGDLYIGIMTIVGSIREVVQMPIHGISSSAQPILSFNYGAGRPDRVKSAIRYMTILLFGYTLICWIILLIFPHFFFQIFTKNTQILSHGILCMHVYFFGYVMMTFQFAGQSVFTGLGKAKQAIFFSLLRKAFIVVPLTLLLPRLFGLGPLGVFLAEPISNLVGGTACFVTMLLTVYRKL